MESRAVPSSLIASLALAAVCGFMLIVSLSSPVADGQILWGALALAAYCTALLFLMTVLTGYPGLGLSAWRLGPWCLVWGALAFGMATITWIGPQTGTPAQILPESVLRALWMIAASMTMLTIGYCVSPFGRTVNVLRRAAEAITRPRTDEIRSPAVPWVLCGVGVAAQVGYALTTGHFGYVGDAAAAFAGARDVPGKSWISMA